ncbi:Uncharacterized protein APZ42_012062 [Daphnia magna]|uniref:Uncharacterized protein n=1 Tax=Daphnia magna TaxID=35525 RepID=A0A0P4XTE1_9CRUS|nr:Uncharacterized protein APZ42_012062 [Daphnia magna]
MVTSHPPSRVTTNNLPSLITINPLTNSLVTRLPNHTTPAAVRRTTPQQPNLIIRRQLIRRHLTTARHTPRLLTTPRADRHTKSQQLVTTKSQLITQRPKPTTCNHPTRRLLTTPTTTMLTKTDGTTMLSSSTLTIMVTSNREVRLTRIRLLVDSTPWAYLTGVSRLSTTKRTRTVIELKCLTNLPEAINTAIWKIITVHPNTVRLNTITKRRRPTSTIDFSQLCTIDTVLDENKRIL